MGDRQEAWLVDGFGGRTCAGTCWASRSSSPSAGEIKANADQPDSPGVGVELVATSVTSSGDGDEGTNSTQLAENPHLKFFKNRRGYVRTKFTAGELRSDFRILPYVRIPDAPVSTAASFVTEDRDPSLHPA